MVSFCKNSQKISHQLSEPNKNTIILKEHVAFDEEIEKIYQFCMTLIEEVACYTQEEGHAMLKKMPKDVGLLYQEEMTRLSTRLMQMASWLLLWRAGRSQEMSKAQLNLEKAKVSLETKSQNESALLWEKLPLKFRNFVLRSLRLETRLRFIDQDRNATSLDTATFVVQQQNRLKEVFR